MDRRAEPHFHYALGEDFWTLCRTYWADAVDTTTRIDKVTCERCLLKHADDEGPPR